MEDSVIRPDVDLDIYHKGYLYRGTRFTLFAILIFFFNPDIRAKEYHISKLGNDQFSGTRAAPFKTISRAARIARPGDVIIIHRGVYREMVMPMLGGTSDRQRITFRAATGEKVEIKGSEVLKGWKEIDKGIWMINIPDVFFDKYNPYKDLIYGDWFFPNPKEVPHTGAVYLNGKPLNETFSREKLSNPNLWYTHGDQNTTTIYANFGQNDPNKQLTEINVRPSCFYPGKTGVNYIQVKGLIMSQAATQWAAPTAEQIGLIGTNWSKGWIIEDNIIYDSKCVGITLGKDRASGHNVWSQDRSRDGSELYNEVILRAIQNGWDKDNVGSHTVRNNKIYRCGAAGICGSLGAVFSRITGNEIYDIYHLRNFYGAEMAGIKIHGAIDVLIEGNYIHDAFIGIWLDWMAQGTRISKNLLQDNDYVDFFPEVNHGPYTVDHNIMLSAFSVRDWSEGGTYLNNLFAGKMSRAPQKRSTPVFLPRSTELVKVIDVKGGDNRFYNNLFLQTCIHEKDVQPKMHKFDSPDSLVGYDLNIYDQANMPVEEKGNMYLRDIECQLKSTKSGIMLCFQGMQQQKFQAGQFLQSGNALKELQSDTDFKGDGLGSDVDYHGNKREADTAIGPFANLNPLGGAIPVWPNHHKLQHHHAIIPEK